MPATTATLIQSIGRSFVSDGGQHMALQLIGDEDEEINLAIPRDEILRLLDACAACRTESDREVGFKDLTCCDLQEWVLHNLHARPDTIGLSLRFGLGGILTFALNRQAARQLSEAILHHLDETPDPLGKV